MWLRTLHWKEHGWQYHVDTYSAFGPAPEYGDEWSYFNAWVTAYPTEEITDDIEAITASGATRIYGASYHTEGDFRCSDALAKAMIEARENHAEKLDAHKEVARQMHPTPTFLSKTPFQWALNEIRPYARRGDDIHYFINTHHGHSMRGFSLNVNPGYVWRDWGTPDAIRIKIPSHHVSVLFSYYDGRPDYLVSFDIHDLWVVALGQHELHNKIADLPAARRGEHIRYRVYTTLTPDDLNIQDEPDEISEGHTHQLCMF